MEIIDVPMRRISIAVFYPGTGINVVLPRSIDLLVANRVRSGSSVLEAFQEAGWEQFYHDLRLSESEESCIRRYLISVPRKIYRLEQDEIDAHRDELQTYGFDPKPGTYNVPTLFTDAHSQCTSFGWPRRGKSRLMPILIGAGIGVAFLALRRRR